MIPAAAIRESPWGGRRLRKVRDAPRRARGLSPAVAVPRIAGMSVVRRGDARVALEVGHLPAHDLHFEPIPVSSPSVLRSP